MFVEDRVPARRPAGGVEIVGVGRRAAAKCAVSLPCLRRGMLFDRPSGEVEYDAARPKPSLPLGVTRAELGVSGTEPARGFVPLRAGGVPAATVAALAPFAVPLGKDGRGRCFGGRIFETGGLTLAGPILDGGVEPGVTVANVAEFGVRGAG